MEMVKIYSVAILIVTAAFQNTDRGASFQHSNLELVFYSVLELVEAVVADIIVDFYIDPPALFMKERAKQPVLSTIVRIAAARATGAAATTGAARV